MWLKMNREQLHKNSLPQIKTHIDTNCTRPGSSCTWLQVNMKSNSATYVAGERKLTKEFRLSSECPE